MGSASSGMMGVDKTRIILPGRELAKWRSRAWWYLNKAVEEVWPETMIAVSQTKKEGKVS